MNEASFSWAENADGKMVHVDSVPRGIKCGCVCPCCHEELKARHGCIRAHGFAHRSKKRRANLRICYMVIMYKLAEQIIQEEKKIHVPSYYGIIKEHDIEFKEVIIDGRYDRIDKQPDVIATTTDGEQLIIEFTFEYKVQHKEEIDYQNLNCIEINLSNQTLESLYDFLLNSNEDRKWINNQSFFDSIKSRYSEQGKTVKVINMNDCDVCVIKDKCCGERIKGQYFPLEIYNSGQTYHICKTEQYEELLRQFEEFKQQNERQKHPKKVEHKDAETQQATEQIKSLNDRKKDLPEMRKRRQQHREESARLKAKNEKEEREAYIKDYQSKHNESPNNKFELLSCFMCMNNIDSLSTDDGYAHCKLAIMLKVPKNTPPETANGCRDFIKKE